MDSRKEDSYLSEEHIIGQYAVYEEMRENEEGGAYDEDYPDEFDDPEDTRDSDDLGGEPPRKKTKGWIIALIVVLFAALAGFGAYYYYNSLEHSPSDVAALMDNGTIYGGVMIDKVPVGGFTAEQAKEKIAEHEQSRINALKWDVTVDGKAYSFSGQEIKTAYNFEALLDDALLVGRVGDVFARVTEVKSAEQEGREFVSEFSYDKEALSAIVEDICKKSDVEPKDASMELDLTKSNYADRFVYTDEQAGLTVKKEELLTLCTMAIDSQLPAKVNAPVDKPEPKVKVAELKANMENISKFSTDYSSSASGRAKNVEKAVDKINGTLLLPGEEFSSNKTWGQRTPGNGWHLAPEIVNGDLKQGYGGGICQVSGTLFNAVIMANLEIVERQNHSFPSTYVKIGFDATVDWNGPDFRFKNNTEYPIVIFGKTENREVKFEIWGKQPSFAAPNMEITRESTVTRVLQSPSIKIINDPSMPATYSKVEVTPRQGRVVKSVIQFIVDGKVVHTIEWVSTYRTINGVTVVGSKKPAETPVPSDNDGDDTPKPSKPPKPTPEPDDTDNE